MRVKLSEKYINEREEICKTLISIIGLNTDNTFLLCELDSNIEKQTAILNLKEEIQKYFACSTISSFKPGFECKRPYLNIIRSILRKQDYTFTGDDIFFRKPDETYIKTMKYKVFRNNQII
jgi:hypothetical protein